MDKLKRRVANKKLNEEEVKIIKEIKKQGYSYKKVWELFKNKITLSGFEKIWYGQNWKKGE
jgi:transposase